MMTLLNSKIFPNYNAGVNKIAVSILILNGVFFNSIFMHLFSISGAFVVLLNIFLVVCLVGFGQRKAGIFYIFIFLFMSIFSFAQSIFFVNEYYIFYPYFFLSSLFVIMICSRADISLFIDFTSFVFLWVLIFSIITFIMVLSGLSPAEIFENRDGRPLYFFYLSFSNSYFGNTVRPAGIFDEPGALSFFVSALCCLRILFKKNEGTTFFILIMGFITMSLAHAIFVLFYALSQARVKQFLTAKSIITLAILIALSVSLVGDIFYDMLILRFSPQGEGLIAGDNRSALVLSSLNYIGENLESILVGIGPDCLTGSKTCIHLMGNFNSNPFEPIIRVGILQGWVYYLFIFIMLLAPAFGRKYFIVAGFGLLLLQRPYLMHVSYSFYSILIFLLFFKNIIFRANRSYDEKNREKLHLVFRHSVFLSTEPRK
jgi:hypothetical protein